MPTDDELRNAFNAGDVNKDGVIDIDESVGNSSSSLRAWTRTRTGSFPSMNCRLRPESAEARRPGR